MENEIKFYKCSICGNVVEVINGDVNRVRCCGQEMQELVANSVDAATEKQVPVVEKEGNEIIVKVGSVAHPMLEVHSILWIAQVVGNTISRVNLKPGEDAIAKFPYVKGATVYAYCNLHGLWKTIVD